ncbi:MAG: DUF2752 domain-containing protein [Chryseobacterium sp.]|nr:MAG: DUF2752 domain-containing protein [Chryseobacterium sp.]
MKKIAGYIAVVLLLSVAVAVFYRFDPAAVSFFPRCPFKTLTGWDCPGCGSQRAVHELLHGNLRNAFRYNPLMVAAVPYVSVGLVFNCDRVRSKCPAARKLLFGRTAIYTILMIIIVFFILRNLL